MVAKLASFTLVKADVTGNSPDERALLKRFSLFGPPGIMFFSADGKPLPAATVVGFESPEQFLGALSSVIS